MTYTTLIVEYLPFWVLLALFFLSGWALTTNKLLDPIENKLEIFFQGYNHTLSAEKLKFATANFQSLSRLSTK